MNKGWYQKISLDIIKQRVPNFITLDESTYMGTNRKARFIDSEYGEWWAMPYSVFRGQTHPKRGLLKNKQSHTLSLQELKDRLPSHITVQEDSYINASQKCIFVDSEYGEFIARPTMVLQGKKQHPDRIRAVYTHPQQKMYIDGVTAKDWCTQHGLPYSSLKAIWHLGETYIKEWAKDYTTSKSTLEVLVSQRLNMPSFNKYPTDELKYKPDFKLTDTVFLNVDGLYWHSEKHKSCKKYHFIMREAFLHHNMRLLQFTADMVVKKWTIVESIINNILGQSTVYYARKCKIVPLTQQTANGFLNKNHIMGTIKARHIGLEYNGLIIACFSYKISKNHTLKIERFCNLINTTTVGGLSKILSYLINNHPIKYIQSWVDLRYGTGNSLLKLGFKHVKTTLGWKWTDGINTYNRLRCRANMDKRKLTEREYANELGWYRIYDAGQALFVKEL